MHLEDFRALVLAFAILWHDIYALWIVEVKIKALT